MTHTAQLLETTPNAAAFDRTALTRCIDACFDCAQACTSCADACLGEETVSELRRCIALDLMCADVCLSTGRTLSMQLGANEAFVRTLLEACAEAACAACAAECEAHAGMHEHCHVCADACRSCEDACRSLLA